jgi:hypothetical protein
MQTQSAVPLKARFKDAAARHGLTRNQLYRLIADDPSIAVYKIGRGTHIDIATLDAAIERRRVTELPTVEEMRRRRQIAIDRKRRVAGAGTILKQPGSQAA